MKHKSKSDIKLIIESLYDLGVITKKKRRRRRRRNARQTIQQQIKSSSEHMTGYSQANPNYFHNTSNLQNEVLRNSLYQIENEKKLLPQLTDITNKYAIENQQIKNGVLYLLDKQHNQPEYDRFYSPPSISRLPSTGGYDGEDNIDVSTTTGSDRFESQKFKKADNEDYLVTNPFETMFNSVFSTPAKIDKKQSEVLFDGEDEQEDSIPIPPELKIASPRTPVKSSRLQERDRLKEIYKQKGGVNNDVMFSQSKLEISGAIKQLDDLVSFKHEYALLGGSDNEFINADLKSLTKLKKEVQKIKRQSKK